MHKIAISDLYYSSILEPSLLDIFIFKCQRSKYAYLRKLSYKLESFKYRKCTDKLVQTNKLNDVNIKLTPPYQKESYTLHINTVHKTKPFEVYEIILENGYTLKCADNHIVLVKDLQTNTHNWVNAQDLIPGQHKLFVDTGEVVHIKSVLNLHYLEFMYDVSVIEDNHCYNTNGIISHNTTTTAAFFAWVLCFHNDKNAFVVANKKETAIEIIGKMKEVLEGLPFFLKPGIILLRDNRIKFENGCSLRAGATSKTPATGDSIQYLYIDEAAVIPPNIIDEFWASVEPTMSSFRGNLIIMSSTPRGKGNLFHRTYEGAINGTNEFIATRVDWWEVPGRDAAWEKSQRIKLGDEFFNREFGLSFESGTSRLISAYYLNLSHRIEKTFIQRDLYRVPENIWKKIYWHPDFDPGNLTYYDLLQKRFLFVVDTAEGIEKGTAGKKDADYNVINIFEISTLSPNRIERNRQYSNPISIKDVLRFKQVGIYLDNFKDEEEAAEAAKWLTFQVFKSGFQEIDSVRILIEMNFNGKNWVNKFKEHPGYYDPIIIKCARGSGVGADIKYDYGFKTVGGKKGKNYYCELGAKMMDKTQIIILQINDKPNMSSIAQLLQFGKNSKGLYEGNCMHDDIAVTCFWPTIALEQPAFLIWCEEWLESLYPTPNIQQIHYMLNTYIETEPEVSDEEFSRFFNMATAHNSGGLKLQQNTYGSLMNSSINNTNNRNSSSYTTGSGVISPLSRTINPRRR